MGPGLRRDDDAVAASLLPRFRRRRAVQHVTLGALQQIDTIGLDEQRPALALQFRNARHLRKEVLEEGLAVGTQLVDIEQLAREQLWIRLAHVDPADALVL